jgi:AcrR family transcriptional regulator
MSTEQRDALLQAATEVFSRYGFKKASIDDIARRAGIGKGTVYLHFDSKEALFATVVRDLWGGIFGDFRTAVRQARTPDGKLRAFCRARLEEVAVLARAMNIAEEFALELIELARPYVHEFRERELALIEEILAEGTATGVFVARKPRLIAVGLLTWLEALVPVLMAPAAPHDLRAGTDELLEAMLRGLSAKPGAPTR